MNGLVVARLTGGLGNQLFQYAAALGTAHRLGCRAAVDASSFLDGIEWRRYGLDRYDLGIPVLKGCRFDSDFGSIDIPAQPGRPEARRLPVYRQDVFGFEESAAGLRVDQYLYGFWQSWKYFAPIAGLVRDRLSIAPSERGANRRIMHQIDRTISVSVHVRRGDYLRLAKLDGLGICGPDYYEGAFDLMRRRLKAPAFFVFSDDPEWCRGQITAPDVMIVSTEDSDPTDDLALMARCRHHILANSSFSWWGAWLGSRSGSIAVAPVPWYAQAPRAADLIPKDWYRLGRDSGATWDQNQMVPRLETVSAVVLVGEDPAALSQAVTDVRAQSYPVAEIVLVLAGRLGASSALAESLARQNPQVRLVWTRGNDRLAALDAGIAAASSVWVAFLQDGDRWLPNKLSLQIDAAQLGGIDVVGCRTVPKSGAEPFPPAGRPDSSVDEMIRNGRPIAGISHTLVRRSVLQSFGRFEGTSADHDIALWQRLYHCDRIVVLWDRLVVSPVPFLASSDQGSGAWATVRD